MITKTVKLDPNTWSTLMRSRIDGNNLFLPGQLALEDYMRVAKAIEAAGGKWNKKAGCHVFPRGVRETLDINEDSVSVVDVQQTEQAFYTPPGIASQVCELANLTAGDKLLEPSAGTGRLLQAAVAHGIRKHNITAVELQPRLWDELRKTYPYVVCCDFMSQTPAGLGMFNKILMNPPFTRGQDIKHIQHARQFLTLTGRLVAICGAGPKQRAALEPLAVKWVDLEPGAFKESGTNVSAAIVVIER